MRFKPHLHVNDKGLYCPAGDFYIDPMRSVSHAVVTHAHSDHARRGSREYIVTPTSVGLMKARLGHDINIRSVAYGEKFQMGSAWLSFHSAGHILGSAQVRIEIGSDVWVVTGDYKREPDPSCEPFEVVPCDVFVTEATFGTPAFKWERKLSIGQEIYDWYQANRAQGVTSIVLGYSLGKSQRILAELLPYMGDEEVWIHATLAELTQVYRDHGIAMCRTRVLDHDVVNVGLPKGKLLLAPPSMGKTDWMEKIDPADTAFASGWMSGKGRWTRDGPQKGFVVSDHADWPALLKTIAETGCRQVYVMQRGKGALVRHLRMKGISADGIDALRLPPEDPSLKNQLKLFKD